MHAGFRALIDRAGRAHLLPDSLSADFVSSAFAIASSFRSIQDGRGVVQSGSTPVGS